MNINIHMNKYIYKLNFDFFCKKNVKIEIQIHLYGKLQNTIIFKIYFKNYLCQSFRYYFLIFISALKLLDSKKNLPFALNLLNLTILLMNLTYLL